MAFRGRGDKGVGALLFERRQWYILCSPPGGGKSSLVRKLQESPLQLHRVSSGDWYGQERQANTPVGVEAGPYIDRGDLVPARIHIPFILRRMADKWEDHWLNLWDGAIRRPSHWRYLTPYMQGDITLVFLDTPVDEARRRAIGRGRGPDDAPDQVDHRLEVYRKSTRCLIRKIQRERQYPIVRLNGMKTTDEIAQDFFNAIGYRPLSPVSSLGVQVPVLASNYPPGAHLLV